MSTRAPPAGWTPIAPLMILVSTPTNLEFSGFGTIGPGCTNWPIKSVPRS